MSYKVSSEATYDDLTYEEADLLYCDMEALQQGKRTEHLLTTFEAWCREAGYEDSVLILSTIFSLKVMLSLVRYYRTS